MQYKIRYYPMHPLYVARSVPYVPVRVTRGALVAHRYTYAPSRCWTSQYCITFVPYHVSLWNNRADPVFDGVLLPGFKSRANAFLSTYAARAIFVNYCYRFLFFLSIGWYCGAGVFWLIGCKSLYPILSLVTFLIIIINIIYVFTISTALEENALAF